MGKYAKAFDSVIREFIRNALDGWNTPEKLLAIIRATHDDAEYKITCKITEAKFQRDLKMKFYEGCISLLSPLVIGDAYHAILSRAPGGLQALDLERDAGRILVDFSF